MNIVNPYTDPIPLEEREFERTVLVDPATGVVETIGARFERFTIDPESGVLTREVTNVVTATKDGQELLYPYNAPLFTCSVCGTRPLMQPFRCNNCQRPMCAECRVVDEELLLCRSCDGATLFGRLVRWLGKV